MHSQKDFLSAIVGNYFDEGELCLVVCSQLDAGLIPHHCRSVDEAIHRIAAFTATHNIYVSLGLLRKPRESSQRGSEPEVQALLGLVIDIDCQHPQRKKSGHFESVPEAVSALEALPLKPSLLVSTGFGVHAYWLWKEAWDISDPEEHALARSISQGWNAQVKTQLGKTIDPTFALNHIYRVPGTINQKYEEKPICEVLELSDRRYDPTEFEPFCSHAVTHAVTTRLAPIVDDLPVRVKAAIENSSEFRSSWNHKDRDQADTSQSGWDWRIASTLIDAEFEDQDVAQALYVNRREHGGKVKPKRYYERTISKIRGNRQQEETSEEEDGWYVRLSRMAGVKVIAIELEDPKHSVEDCIYWVRFASGGRYLVRKDSQIRNLKYWHGSLRGLSPLDQTKVLHVEKNEWLELMEKLRLHVVVLEQQSAAQGIINEIAAYLDQTSVDVDDYGAIRKNDRRPVRCGNQYLFIYSDFLVWYAKLYGRIDKAALRSALDELKSRKRRLGPHAIEYVEVLAGNLREEASLEGKTHHLDSTGGARGGGAEDPSGHGDLAGDSEEGDGVRGLPGFNHPN